MVQGYVERGLLNVHEVGTTQTVRDNLLYFLAGVAFVSILPYLHIGVLYKLLHGGKGKVNRTTCSCDCFDTVFRGPYEYPPSGYKHVYFNATINSLKIWVVTVIFIIAIYETLKYLLKLWKQRLLRKQMFYLVAMTTYAHYYSWWSYFGYYNEDFYYQWYHQTVFTITEIISTALVLNLCNKDNPLLPWKLLLIININMAHLITGGVDQFFSQLLSGTGRMWQNVRNIGLILPDIFHILIPIFAIRDLARKKRVRPYEMFHKEEFMVSFVMVLLFYLITKNL